MSQLLIVTGISDSVEVLMGMECEAAGQHISCSMRSNVFVYEFIVVINYIYKPLLFNQKLKFVNKLIYS